MYTGALHKTMKNDYPKTHFFQILLFFSDFVLFPKINEGRRTGQKEGLKINTSTSKESSTHTKRRTGQKKRLKNNTLNTTTTKDRIQRQKTVYNDKRQNTRKTSKTVGLM